MSDLINIDNLTDKIWTLWSEYYKDGDKTSQEILDISKADILKFAEQQANGVTTGEKQCNLPVVSQRSELLAFIAEVDNKRKEYPIAHDEEIVDMILKANCG